MATARPRLPRDIKIAISRKFDRGIGSALCASSRSKTAVPLLYATQNMIMLMPMNKVASSLGNHAGSSLPKIALKPRPIPTVASPLRIQPAKVRSFAITVRSSAQSVRSSDMCVRFSASFRLTRSASPMCHSVTRSRWPVNLLRLQFWLILVIAKTRKQPYAPQSLIQTAFT